MSGVKMEQVVLRNFKCHKEFKVGLSELNILTGSNAAGKSSFIQAILLAFQSWEEYDKKIINTNYIYGVNLGIPSSIVSENSDGKDIILEIVCGDSINKAVLGVDEDNGNDMHVKILNSEDIAVQRGEHHNLKQMNLFFLNAERQGPRVVSAIQKIQPNFVGYAGENTGYMISEMDKRQKLRGIKLPDGLKISALDRFSANCEAWLDVVVPNTELQCSVDMERNLSTVRFKNEGEFYLPTATGFGITYVLPIIVQALVASTLENSVLIVENPEAHLHPLSQSRLGKFLALVAWSGVQVLVETHSEHIIDGCRIQAAKEKMCGKIKILFFEKTQENSTCKSIKVQEDGELEEWPAGFFDQKRQDLRELLGMKRCGN